MSRAILATVALAVLGCGGDEPAAERSGGASGTPGEGGAPAAAAEVRGETLEATSSGGRYVARVTPLVASIPIAMQVVCTTTMALGSRKLAEQKKKEELDYEEPKAACGQKKAERERER